MSAGPRTSTRASRPVRPPGLVLVAGLALALCAPGCGRGPADPDPAVQQLGDEERQRLEILGYVNTVPVAETAGKAGVTLHDPEKAFAGFNFFNARHESVARLMDMDGAVVHTWRSDATGAAYRAFQARMPDQMPSFLEAWNHVELLPDGGILAIGSHHSLLRLDRDSRLVWQRDLAAHHDLDVTPDGDIYVLVDVLRTTGIDGGTVAFQDDVVAVLDARGRPRRRYSLYDAFSVDAWRPRVERSLRRIPPYRKARLERLRRSAAQDGPGAAEALRLYAEASAGRIDEDAELKNVLFHNNAEDIFHANSIQVLPDAEPGLWSAGDLLVCLRRFDSIAVIDRDKGRVVWSWGPGELDRPHHATRLPGGEILIFDNGTGRGWSRIVRVAPARGEIVWQYVADPPGAFFSAGRGGAQQLPNGNVLVASTDSGQAFEVTAAGKVVWQYFSEPTEAGHRAALYRMQRFSPAEIAARLGALPVRASP